MMKLLRVIFFVLISATFAGNGMAGPKKVYLVNGLLSMVLGYGLTNLKKKIPYARHFKFAGGVAKSTVDGIIADATKAYNADPTTRISLVGISQGANAVTRIAATLNKRGVRVHYLGVIEGGTLSPIYANVTKADNFICENSGCARKPIHRAGSNTSTRMNTFNLDTGHVDSGNHPMMHRRVIAQINSN
jgi:hypothetical protein